MSKRAKRVRFWLVWNEDGRSPTYKHSTRVSAETEARRLSESNPDHAFFVLKPVGGSFALPPAVRQIEMTKPVATDDIPF